VNIVGLLRVKNEARWIDRVLRSITGICSSVVVFDDHSTDNTRYRAVSAGPDVIVKPSPFPEGEIDEARDKDCLLQAAFHHGVLSVGDWALMIDGDEELHQADGDLIRSAASSFGSHSVFSLQVLYLWNEPDLVRTDGVYGTFARPSLFRVRREDHTFRRTGNGGNFHCGNIPSDYLYEPKGTLSARLLHWGYFDEELRRRKFEFYNRIDPDNTVEDRYRHITQGDPGGASAKSRLKHAGPLRLARI